MSATQKDKESKPSRRIGFLVPEFPGQTLIVLWREKQAVQSLDQLAFSK
jgi:hypothetical protein